MGPEPGNVRDQKLFLRLIEVYFNDHTIYPRFHKKNNPMNNNDILRSLRYTFDFNDATMLEIFALGGMAVTRAEVSDWLKKDSDPEFKTMDDVTLSGYLNGLIVLKRGRKEGEAPVPEREL